MAASFIHLRVRTAYSLLEGAILPKKLPGLCEKAGMPAVGITDTGNLFGALEIAEGLVAAGLFQVFSDLVFDIALDGEELPARRAESVNPDSGG